MLVLALATALVLMTIGAEALVRGASSLAYRFGVSPLFVGMTVVALGTSAPELASSILAASEGSSGIAVGNVVGSNIFNVAVILGISAMIKPLVVSLEAIRRDVVVACVASAAPLCAVFTGEEIRRWLGAVMVIALVAYTYISFRHARTTTPQDGRLLVDQLESTPIVASSPTPGTRGWILDVSAILAGLLALVAGAGWFVATAVQLARWLGLSELTIGLTVVSAGTSMPELVTSVVAAIRGKSDIAVANVVGSSIFNILGVLGLSAVFLPQHVAPRVLYVDVPVMLGATLALLPILRSGGKVSRLEGSLLVAAYGVYVYSLL